METPTASSVKRWFTLVALIISGEMIFSLPFHVPRYFRPSMLETFSLSNAELGDVFAVYGVMAMLAYFPGGVLADRIAPRKLMSGSLLATAAGGLYLWSLPGIPGLRVLYGYWGVTTVLLFWAAMIRATRSWGGSHAQGRAFGLLEGGRGLAAAGFASLAVVFFAAWMPITGIEASVDQRDNAMRAVVMFYSMVTAAAGVLVWCLLSEDAAQARTASRTPFGGVQAILARPLVWLQALVVICAYCGYKGLDNYSLYAFEILDMSEVEAASFTATAAYIRPLAALGAGLLADRCGAGRTISWLFLLLVVVYAALASLAPTTSMLGLIYANLIVSFVAVFALRAVYFALLEETAVPKHLTGTAVGLVSVLGYTPDIFFAPVAGRLLDASPGLPGHQHYFWFLTALSLIGLITALMLARVARRTPQASHRGELS